MTGIGLWFVLLALIVAVAATNTGNNALFLVLAVMLGILVVSGLVSWQNLLRLEPSFHAVGEVFANRPFELPFSVVNRHPLLPHWFLRFELEARREPPKEHRGQPRLIPYLARRSRSEGRLEVILARRGYHQLGSARVSSPFPFGFFKKERAYPVEGRILAFPELFEAGDRALEEVLAAGDSHSRRAGWGHELHQLRDFRSGDDPRGIHWKQTARTSRVIFTEREAEQTRRVSILFDNVLPEVPPEVADPSEDGPQARFEHLVSEAATAGVDLLERGFEVELVTRAGRLPFRRGRRQRLAILETLALIEATEPETDDEPLRSADPRAPELRLGGQRSEA